MSEITILDSHNPHLFPDTKQAWGNGLLAAGGDLSSERLFTAYRLGIFPWPMDGHLLWWSPDPRMVLFPENMHLSRSLKKRITKADYRVAFNTDFKSVISLCANNRYRNDTWITSEILTAYRTLHEMGHAHSIEIFIKDKLVGGLYGLAIGGIFFGESMFHLAPDCAKLAMHALCVHAQQRGIRLIDCQVENDFLVSLGATTLSREEFERQLSTLIHAPVTFATRNKDTSKILKI